MSDNLKSKEGAEVGVTASLPLVKGLWSLAEVPNNRINTSADGQTLVSHNFWSGASMNSFH